MATLPGLNPTPTPVTAPPAAAPPPGNGIDAITARNANALVPPGMTRAGGAYLRNVDPNDLTSNQLTQLESQNSPLMQLALAQGANAAAATGNANGTLMSGASENALLDKLTPIAAQNAQVFERGQQANQDAANTARNTSVQAQAQIAAAQAHANAQRYSADVSAKTSLSEFTQGQAQQLGEFTTNWSNQIAQAREGRNWQTANQATQNEFNLKAGALTDVMGTIFSDPSYWNDPQGSMGMMNYFSSNIGGLIDSLFPNQTSLANNAAAGAGATPAPANPNIPAAGP